MNEIIARAFVVSRLLDGQLHALHAIEKREGYLMPPCFIHEHFDTESWGEVPEEAQSRVSPVVVAIWGSAEAQARARGEFTRPVDFHKADWEIRKRGLQFQGTSTGASARQRILAGERGAA